MSYVRPAKVSEVVAFLAQYTNNGIVEVDANALAEALVKEWDLVGIFRTPV